MYTKDIDNDTGRYDVMYGSRIVYERVEGESVRPVCECSADSWSHEHLPRVLLACSSHALCTLLDSGCDYAIVASSIATVAECSGKGCHIGYHGGSGSRPHIPCPQEA